MLPSRALSVKWSQSPVSASSSLSALAEVRPELLHSGALPLAPLPAHPQTAVVGCLLTRKQP